MLNPTPVRRPLARPFAAAAALLVIAATLLSGTPAIADDRDGLSGAPADETAKDGRSRFDYQVAPGQSLEDRYEVKNTGTTPQVMTVFATDAFNTPDGSFALLDTDAPAEDVGTWITFAGGATSVQVPLDPGQAQVIPIYLAVPADASPGDHAGGIVISSLSGEGQVLVDRRVATRLYVRVPGDLQPGLSISDVRAEYAGSLNPLGGETTISFTVANTGNVALSADLWTGVKTWFGIGASERLHTDVPELLPGSTREISTVVPGVWQLGYLESYIQLAPKIDTTAINPGPLEPVERSQSLFAMPWWLLVALGIAAIVLVVVRVRRRIDDRRAAVWVEYMEEEARRKAVEDGEPSLASAVRGGEATR